MKKIKTLSLIGVAVVGVGVAYSQVIAQTPLQDRVNILRRKIMELRAEETAQNRPLPAASREQSEKNVVLLRQKIIELRSLDSAPADAAPPSQQAQAVVILREKLQELKEQEDKLVLLLRYEVDKYEAARLAAASAPPTASTADNNETVATIEPLTAEAELAALTAAYKADQVTPGQYHRERARLVAQLK